MLFIPKLSKYKKYQKGVIPNKLKNNCNLNFKINSSLKLVAITFGNLTVKQLTAVRFLIKKFIKKKGILKFIIFPQRSVSKKPSEIRMGKGKGNFSHWTANIKKGNVICEIFYKPEYKRRICKILKRAQIRLPILTTVIL
jgi:large subunit ribosomal protein L16